MDEQTPKSLLQHFSSVNDPRIDRTKRHKLIDILVIAICATICGAETWEDFELFVYAKKDWFNSFLELPSVTSVFPEFQNVLEMVVSQQYPN